MGWARHVARTGDRLGAYRVLVERLEGKKTFGRPRHRLDDNIKMYLQERREEQRLEAAQMKFLRHLLGITKLDKENDQCIRQKNWSTEHSKGNKTVPGKVATTCTEDGHKQSTKTSTTI